jgi:hypothetical protein
MVFKPPTLLFSLSGHLLFPGCRLNLAVAFDLAPVGCSELGGVYDSCNLFLGLGRRERKSQVLLQPALLLWPLLRVLLAVIFAIFCPHTRAPLPANLPHHALPCPLPCLQALYPWRRVLREMFHHDSQLGQLYCLRGTHPVMVRTPQLGL